RCTKAARVTRDDPRTDDALIAAANRGDVAAFEALYRRHRDWVVALAYRFTGNRDDALDVLQETFIYWLGKFPGFRLTARLRTFLYPVVKHVAAEKRRKSARYAAELPADEAVVSPAPNDGPASRADLADAMAGLSEVHREVVLMRFVDGFTLQEIAAALDVPVGTIKSRLHVALDRLRTDERAKKYFEP
ncbi:MAG: RNA polymerase sigma factor, partial [Phycisphaerae bacterium]|nr:RNA polymerase sigma factor [Phycisphaerae bacterium]